MFTEVNMATATAGEVPGSWQICERVMLKRRKRRKKINTLMMSIFVCGAELLTFNFSSLLTVV